MTKYKLEEFKQWLEADPSRKGGLTNWDQVSVFCYFTDGRESLEAIAKGTPRVTWNPPHLAVMKNWIAEVNQAEKNNKDCEQQLQELSNLLFPSQPYNFNQLKQEITRLKYQELAPQVREEKDKFAKLITSTKNKTGNSKIIDLLLEAQQQKEQTTETSQKDKLSGKIEAYQTILEDNLTKAEIQILLNKQTELQQLEKHLASLQINEQVAQIQQINPQ